MSFIQTGMYKQIIEVLPILCVDVVIQNTYGEYLLIKRANEPKKGCWWVIGGRVLKGETCEKAAIRKIREEVSLDVKAVLPVGYFELLTDAHPFDMKIPYHTVSIVYKTSVDDNQQIKLDNQSAEWKYAKKLPVDFYIKSFKTHEAVKAELCKERGL